MQINLFLLALMGLKTRPKIHFSPMVDRETRQHLESNTTVRAFWPPFEDVLQGATSPLSIIIATDAIRDATPDTSLRYPTLAGLLSASTQTANTASTSTAVYPITACTTTTRYTSDTSLPAEVSDYVLEHDAPRARPAAVKPAKMMRFYTDSDTDTSGEIEDTPGEPRALHIENVATQKSMEPDSQTPVHDFITEADLAIMNETPEENFNIMQLAADDHDDMTALDFVLNEWKNA